MNSLIQSHPTSSSSGGGGGSVNSVTASSPLASSGGTDPNISLTGVIALANGGSAKALTAVAGGIVWTDADSMEISAAGTSAQLLVSNGTSAPSWITTVPVANGGTGQTTYTNGQLLIGNTTGNTLAKATLTAGTGISITNGTGTITIATSGSSSQVTKTANYTITATDGTIFVDTSGGAFNLTVPDPTTVAGKLYRIIDTKGTLSTNNLTLVRNGSEKIEGIAASRVFQTDWAGWTLTTDGVDWFLF